MGDPQLDYASTDPASRFIADRLLAQEQSNRLKLLTKLLFGIPASFAAPAIVGSISVSIASRSGTHMGFWPLFAVLSLLLIPLIYWRASRHRTDFFGDAAAEVGLHTSDVYRTSSYGEWEFRGNWLTWAAYLEILFWGPYIVLEAYQTWRADQSVALACRTRATQIVRELVTANEGVPLAALRSSGEAPGAFAAAIRYLHHHDWVGLSERKDRIWLLTEAHERLRGIPVARDR